MIAQALARQAAGAAGWLGPAALAVLHAVVLRGVFERSPAAVGVAEYLFLWPVAEFISLVVAPWLMHVTVKDHDEPLWMRILWFPVALFILGGVVGTIRFLQVTWVYFIARIPTVLFERRTRQQAELGCARSLLAIVILVVLMAVFGNRPLHFPIGTIVGRGLSPHERDLANSMAMGMCYFALLTMADVLIHRAVCRGQSSPPPRLIMP